MSADGRAPLAVVTMVYNEPEFLPLWCRYYGAQVGPTHCYVIDHGSDDGSAAGLGAVNRLRIPRSPLDETRRAEFVSGFCGALLSWYGAVLYCDVDELIVADPRHFVSLVDYVGNTRHGVVTAFGMNLLHWVHREVELDAARPILMQRSRLLAVSSMAKPLLIRRPVRWEAGFHSADAPVVFDGLFNFHLAFVDLPMAWRRQAKRRASDYSSEHVAGHHRVDDQTLLSWMEGWSALPPADDVRLDETCPHYPAMAGRILASERGDDAPGYRIDTNIWANTLWRVPDRFRLAF